MEAPVTELHSIKVVTGAIDLDGLEVRVNVLETKQAYGRALYLVTPCMGGGIKWMASVRIHNSAQVVQGLNGQLSYR